jgi:uncharacterized membrane protein
MNQEVWPIVIIIHAIAASFSLLFGAYQLLRKKKGDKPHRIIGWIWVISMYAVIFTSFGIRTLSGGFTWLHALSVLTFFTVTIGLVTAIKGNIKSHKAFMQGSYYGVLGAFVGVIAVPTRRIPQMAMFDLPSFVTSVALIAVVTLSVIGISHLSIFGKKSKSALK